MGGDLVCKKDPTKRFKSIVIYINDLLLLKKDEKLDIKISKDFGIKETFSGVAIIDKDPRR